MSKRVTFTFGRFNPPHRGHGLVFEKMAEQAQLFETDRKIFASHTFDGKNNPLAYREKLSWIRKLFPEHKEFVTRTKHRTIIDIMKSLQADYGSVTLVLGEDRVADMKDLLLKYNGKEYTFEEIEVVSAGQRDDTNINTKASATTQRLMVEEDNFSEFQKGLPEGTKQKTALKLYEILESRMGLINQEPMSFKQFVEVINENDMTKREQLIENFRRKK